MNKFKLILLVTLIFAAGFAAGIVTTRLAVRQFVRRAITQPELVRGKIERDLSRQLRLDAVQRDKVRQILLDAHTRIRTLRSQYQPELEAILRDAQSDISALLRPGQRERFERYRAERERWFQPK
jgi:C4-dicarboxylate-specific signal transduction histidine kinase